MIRSIMLPIGSLLLLFILNISNVNGAAVMSVDLGSEWMKVGVISPGVPMEIALNKESKRKTPAAIAFRDGIRSFGEDAQSLGVRFPSNVYFYLLDLLGKKIDNPIVELFRKRFPYYEIVGDEERNTVVFKNGDQLFRVEELVAQLLMIAREFAENTANQPITECVLVVPGYFGQAERVALLTAAQLANLKVLQLINDYAAVALNYGVFRRTEINETAQYYVFYDMGAHKTSAALVSYQLVKDKATKEANPVIQVLGVGYDRTLGGLEIQLRLRDYLATEFNKMNKTKTDIFTNARAMAKLFKEAHRVKNVLSANADHFAQVENVLEDHDFKFQVTREKLEEICSDLWPRVIKPLEQAFKVSGLTMDVVNQVILFGGGTRVPKVQEILREAIKQDLGKNLNADEAATMGAVYKAADLTKGFKVKKFVIKDAVVFPMQAAFEKKSKYLKRMLFGLMNSYPQKKVITFKHDKDFDFYVNYVELNHLSPEEVSYIGNLNVSRVELKKITEALEKHQGEKTELKNIKVHFTLDDSGLFRITGAEIVIEKPAIADGDDKGTLSKLGSTISKLFSSEDGSKTDDKSGDSQNQEANDGKNDSNTTDSKQNITAQQQQQPESNKNETVKVVEPVEYIVSELYTEPLSQEAFEKSYNKLDQINVVERDRSRRESAFNALESFAIETQEKLSYDEYSTCATEDEKKQIIEECSKISEWLYEGGENADADILEKRLNDIQKITNNVYARHWEHEERPEALKALDKMIENALRFLKHAKALTKEVNPEKDIFTQVEIHTLDKMIEEIVEWKKVETEAQNKLNRYDNVRLTVKDVSEKMSLLDREVNYLINKMKIWKPKVKDTTSNNQTQKNETQTEAPEQQEQVEEELSVDEDESATQESSTSSTTTATKTNKTEERESETTTPHGEL